MLLNAQRIRSPEHPLQLYLYLHERRWDGGGPASHGIARGEARVAARRAAAGESEAELQLLFFSAAGLLTEWRSTPRAS